MAKSIQISIPEPCHEGWNTMTPVDDQRSHCKSCNRVLTDFSQMSDTELALYFVQSKGKICGHFAKSQLNRSIAVPSEKPKKKYWLNALWLLPLTWFAKPAQAQSGIITGKPPVCVNDGSGQKTAATDTVKTTVQEKAPVKLTGIVTDLNTHQAIGGALATLTYRAGNQSAPQVMASAQTDSTGRYTLVLPAKAELDKGSWYITITASDYMNGVRFYKPNEDAVYNFQLRFAEELLDGLVKFRED